MTDLERDAYYEARFIRIQIAVEKGTMRGISEDEKDLMNHISMWGSEGYPVYKCGRGWSWGGYKSISGPPSVFKTKRDAVASFEAFHDILLEAYAEIAYANAIKEAA